MNKLKSLFLGLGLALTGTLSTSCGLMGSEESLFIDSILASPQADGTTIIKITFTDEDIRPVEFVIPAGQDGEQGPKGTGIASVSSKVSEDGKDLVITMTYSDASLAPSVWTIPNATSITNIESMYDEESGMTTVTITTNDGEAHEFELPKGRDGNGVASVTQTTDENKNIIITINYTDPSFEPTVITLPYRNGEDGNGIVNVQTATNSDNLTYNLRINYSDGTYQDVSFAMPEPGTKWHHGYDNPNTTPVEGAKAGDFFFDLMNLRIYMYEPPFWTQIANLAEEVTVTFDARSAKAQISGTAAVVEEKTTVKGNYLTSIPLAVRGNERFLGWYTSLEGPNDPLAGKLTYLTPIAQDVTVYPCFQEVAA